MKDNLKEDVMNVEIMRPISINSIEQNRDFIYEVKYDGFRIWLIWEKKGIRLISRHQKDFTDQFPEVIAACLAKQPFIESHLPIILDGELVILNHNYQANFVLIQKRGRLKNRETIAEHAENRPASFIAFDLLQKKGEDMTKYRFEARKEALSELFRLAEFGVSSEERLKIIEPFQQLDELEKIVFDHQCEGIVAKRRQSYYHPHKQHHDWFKIKNWRIIHGVLTCYNDKNGYYTVSVLQQEEMIQIGKCKHGLDDESTATLKQLFMSQGTRTKVGYQLPPAICASIKTLDLIQGELREPEFSSLLPHISPQFCTIERLKLDLAMFPHSIDLSNTDKLFWQDQGMTKGDLLVYMRQISPYMLPFLKDKALTLLRYPDGVAEEGFFQKNVPDYAPTFIQTYEINGKEAMICNDLESLIWFANHGTVEFHIPFQTVTEQDTPLEIVFDLDPPDRNDFKLAVIAALLIKQLLDDLHLTSFVKTSGSKGLQIHIPMAKEKITYDDTALFTKAVALTLEQQYPHLFTTERLKKNRQSKLYIDYVQHGKDKTIIAPYSPRKTNYATVATPLFWEEVTEELRPEQFTIQNVVDRVTTLGCPFKTYFEAGAKQSMVRVFELIKQ